MTTPATKPVAVGTPAPAAGRPSAHPLVRPAIVSIIGFSVLTLIYTVIVTGLAQVLFPWRANGSLVTVRDTVRGSELIAQPFTTPGYFWPRPSATSPAYNGASSSGSNLGPTNPALAKAVEANVKALHDADPGDTAAIPVDLVTASASGQDPHISPEAAEYQVARVARARRVSAASVRAIVAAHTEGSTLMVLGEPRVNVLLLNLALDSAFGGRQ